MFENDSSHYFIKLQQFEGPFDLLLFFIERDELDIYDIPISKITNDFLEYIQAMDQLNIDLAAEFIVMAAKLMKIKTQMLLPRRMVDEEGNDIDPRQELVRQLVEYKKIKAVVSDMKRFEEERSQRSYRGNEGEELHQMSAQVYLESEWESVNTYNLFKAFQKVLNRYEESKNKALHRIVDFEYNIQNQKEYIDGLFFYQASLSFEDLFEKVEGRIHAIVIFLALLEMVNNQEIRLVRGESVNHFSLEKKTGMTEEE